MDMEQEMNKWIKTGDRLPKEYVDVLYIAINESGHKEIMIGHREKSDWTCCYLFYGSHTINPDLVRVTHWKPLPEYPDNE
jgi:Protein of unknown function (DUF551)